MNKKWKTLLCCLGIAGILSGTFAHADTKPQPENLINVSWGDQILLGVGDAKLDSPDKIKRALNAWKKSADGQVILWRASSEVIDRYYEKRITAAYVKEYYQKVADIQKQFDPLKEVRQDTRTNGQKMLIYMTIYDHGAPESVLYAGNVPFPWQDRYTIEHPGVQVVDRKGNYQYGVLEMAYPQARKLMIDRMVSFVKESGADGIYVCPRSHSVPAERADQFGFSKPVVDAYQKRYGIDILTDPRFDTFSPDFNIHDPAVENWRKLRGESYVEFFRELRTALPGKTIIAGIPRGRYFGAPYGNLYLDWESLVKEKLVDGLVVGVGNMKGLYPKINTPHVKLGYLSSEDDSLNIPSVKDAASSVYGPLTQKYHIKLYFNSGIYGPTQWRLLENEKDLHGFMIDTPPVSTGRAVVLDNPALNFPRGEGTIEAFIRPSQMPKDSPMRILSKYAHPDNKRRGWEWILNTDATLTFRVNQENGNDVTVQTKSLVPANAWTHVATVYDCAKSEMRIYLDGKLDATRKINPLVPHRNPEQDLYIGQYGGSGIGLYTGDIDELRISDVAREFTGMPKQPYNANDPGTVALFHFDAVDGMNLIDATGHLSARLLSASEKPPLENSLPGFGKALELTSTGN